MAVGPTRIVGEGPDGPAPALLFLPADAQGPLPLVLLGHGAHLSKDDPRMQILAKSFCSGVPAGVALMDCAGHGERRAPELSDAEFESDVLERMGDPATYPRLVADWTAVAAAARAAAPILSGPTGYAGFSMGAVFGMAIVGDLADVRSAVFALGGLPGPNSLDPERASIRRKFVLEGVARLGEREVLMLNMTRDEHFPIEGAVEVLEAIPGPKRMAVWTGTHVEISGEAIVLGIDFFRRTLAG